MLKILLLVALCFVASAKNLTPKQEAYLKFELGDAEDVPSREELLKLNFTDFTEKDIGNKTVSFKRYEGKCVFVGFYGPYWNEMREGKLSLKRFQRFKIVVTL